MIEDGKGQLMLDFSDGEPAPPLPPSAGCGTCYGSGYDKNPAIPYLKRCKDCDYWGQP